MADIDVPQYFLCPISLEIMKDPVTTVTGITYDRESIEQWLLMAKERNCPVTKQPLPTDSPLTPNHTLLRLIQAWSSQKARNGAVRIPAPKPLLSSIHVHKLISHLQIPHLCQTTLRKMDALAGSESNRRCMVESGALEALVSIITQKFKEGITSCLEQALRVLRLLWAASSIAHVKPLVCENLDFITSLAWALQIGVRNNVNIVNETMPILKSTAGAADSTLLGNLNVEFFREITKVLKNRRVSEQAIKSALQVLIETCPLGRNRMKIVESGAVFVLIDLELEKPTKNITELVFNLLANLCSCADGREQFLRHAAGIAVMSKRILRVSNATDDRAVQIFSLIAKYSSSNDVVLEMLRVGAVSKLCMVMQADCASYLKEKARSILRLHSKTWNNSPCIQVYLLTRHQR
ncbi:E3 ubiquitin-protein ligase PUB24-like [Prosopis cineraria]|uniref:E3 ubiquitin-protein ligase PUB24-like n=1 Tax=Prosopis cineraria TaxID=364024 RepID=UPI00240F8A38|nr:E3 ubiquitin-protein ligase PUB24-like [Prosopis cineraria]